MYHANILILLNTGTAAEQTGQTTWGRYWTTPNGSSQLKYLLMTLLLVFYLFYKIIIFFFRLSFFKLPNA